MLLELGEAATQADDCHMCRCVLSWVLAGRAIVCARPGCQPHSTLYGSFMDNCAARASKRPAGRVTWRGGPRLCPPARLTARPQK